MGLKNNNNTEGEIVQVQGGHIIRATGRKDRHSKVFTAKGPRDRRVRLAAHTAIQFYDVQDRLGYDRPSKAVDWLIKKAQASIDKLDELPPWDPTANVAGSSEFHVGDNSGGSSSFYVPQAVDSHSQSLADNNSMKCFFPTSNNNISGENNSISFQNYPNSQDLCLSLHTLQDPSGGGGGGSGGQNRTHPHHEPTLFQGSGSSLGFDGGWAESQHQQQHDLGRFTRMFGWPSSSGGVEGRGENLFNNPSPLAAQGLLLGQQGVQIPSAAYSLRGTLQSSFSPLVRVLENQHQHHPQEISGIGHGSDSLMGFYIPSQIHGEMHRASSSSLSPDSSQH